MPQPFTPGPLARSPSPARWDPQRNGAASASTQPETRLTDRAAPIARGLAGLCGAYTNPWVAQSHPGYPQETPMMYVLHICITYMYYVTIVGS